MKEVINKEIYRETVGQKIVQMEVGDWILFTKEDGTKIKFADSHNQDADWEVVNYISAPEEAKVELVSFVIGDMLETYANGVLIQSIPTELLTA